MSSTHAPADQQRSADEARRRKRKERAAKSRTPEPKDIVSGAGQPLDVGVRRELEEQLGHDLGNVRLHTDRDAGALTEMLGADAVAVGQDIFFREGAYAPGTSEGYRLLAHELLHTVQNPYGAGPLTAGRDLGAVSLPHEAAEQEAESTAQRLMREETAGQATAGQVTAESSQAVDVEQGEVTPAWMRYATVDADRMRAETLDPAGLVERLVGGVLRSLRGDPSDASGRVRLELARMAPELQDSVLDRLEVRLSSPEYGQLLDLVDEADSARPALGPSLVPEPVPDATEQIHQERAAEQRREAARDQSAEKKAEDGREEKKSEGAEGGKQQQKQEQDRASQDAAAEKKETAERQEQEDERAQEQKESEQEQQQAEEQQAEEREKADGADEKKAQEGQSDTEQAKEERKAQREREQQDPEQADGPGGDKRKRKDDATKRADGSKQEDVDPKAKGQPGPVRPEKVDERAEERDSALSEHALHEKDEDEGDPREEEQPLDLEAGADKEIGGDEGEQGKPGAGPAEPELKPEDYLPESDLDLSGVPTADKMTPGAAAPSMPSFPAPPPTKAEKVQEQRENDAENEEDEDAPEAETKPPGAEVGPVEGEAPQPEGGPAAEAQDRTEKDLQSEKPVDQEVGPDPETEDDKGKGPEPEPEKADPEQSQEAAKSPAEKQSEEDEKDPEADGEEKPDAKGAAEEQQERKEQDEREERQEGKGQPQGAAADKPASAPAGKQGTGTTDTSATPPAGANTERTKAEDRRPSPAVRRVADSAKGDNEAAGPKSQVPKQTGPGAGPSGTVGSSSEPAGPSAATGPGGAPPVAQAAVSPAGEQTEAPGKMGAPGSEGAKAKPEASLEKDGGGCAPPEPAAEKDEGKGGCGGGGGAKAKEEKKPEPPDVSGQDPKSALNTVSSLPPDQAQAALPGVDASAEKKAREGRKRLAANPPKRERPSGAPQTQSARPESAPPAPEERGKLEKVGPEDEGGKQRAKGGEKAKGKKPTDDVPAPRIAPGKDGKIDADDAGSIEAAADKVPTTDPELRNKTVGPAPKIKLEGKSDPKRTDKQAKKLKEKQGKIHRTGRDDAAKPMGEDKIFPNAPKEELRGDARGGGGGKGGRQAAGSAPKPGVGVVAKQERGREVKGAAGDARGQMVTKEKEHQQGEQREKRQKQAEMDEEVARNAEKQTAERGRAAEKANAERVKWRDEQDKKIEDADKKSEKEHGDQNKKITKGRDDKDKEINDRKDKDNKDIDTKAEKAEKDAKKKKDEKKEESDSLFGKLIDAIGDFFSALLDAVTKIFDAAREAINSVIDKFKEFANKAIDFVRDLAIKAINALADALIAVCDVLLAAFPELRDKFRKAIEGLRDAAIDAVNKLADGLKKAVNALLDALAAGLNALLDVLEAGIKFAIKLYRDAIIGALKFAEAAIEALGKFAALVADIAPDPGGWLSKAGSSAKAGITDHLWGAIKTGVKRWFDAKVEGILGLGKAVINVLVKGCMSIKQIGKMAWDAIIASLPMMIASIVIEKVVSMLVPAAGAILTIVQGLMAAWQSLSSILTAFSKFWAYLKAVKAGPAACLFAEAVAAGIVALLDFIANFLLIRLEMATKGVGKRLKAIAQKIMKGLKKTGKGAKKAAGKAVNKARGAARKAQEALKKPAKPAKPKGPRVPKKRSDSADRGPGANRTPKDASKDRPNSRTPKKDADQRRDEDGVGPTTARPKRDTDAPGKKPDADGGKKTDKPDGAKDKTPDGSKDKDKAPDRPKKKKETEAPKRTKTRKPKSPLGKALKKVKGKVKSALKKIRNAGKALGKKLRKSKLGKGLKNTGKRTRDFFKKKRDKMRDDKRKRTGQKRDRRREKDKNEKSKDAKWERLGKAVRRIRKILKKLLERGLSQPVHRAVLAALRRAFRLSSLEKTGGKEFSVWATLNPPLKTIGGFTDPRDRHDYLEKHGFPESKIPGRRDDSLTNPNANIPNKHANGEFLSKATPRGQKPPAANYGQPKGWQYVMGSGMTEETGWVRMHLLPEALGGLAGGNNLVPARGQRTNLTFYDEIEKGAYESITEGDSLIWYDSVAKFGYDDFPGFPSYIRSTYGRYDKKQPSLDGRSRSHWHRLRQDDSYAQFNIPKPDASEKNQLHINTAGEDTLRNRLGEPLITFRTARAIAGVMPGGARPKTMKNGRQVPAPHPVYHSVEDVKKQLDAAMKAGYGLTPEKIQDVVNRLQKLDGQKQIDWGVQKSSR